MDGELAVNIMPNLMMHDLSVTIEEVSKSQLMIQGSTFKANAQSAWSMSNWSTMGNLLTYSIFYVIDAKTSYKLLLRQPWLYKHGIVASTLHKCLKCCRGTEKKINGNVKPFTKVESHFVDASFFKEDDTPKEKVLSTILSVGKGGTINTL